MIDRKTIRAPFAGVLGIRQVNLGQYLGGGAPIVSLQAVRPAYVNFTVPQQEIGRLKRDTNLPVYEPEREKTIFENVQKINPGPLDNRDLLRIYERMIDVMRQIQKEKIGRDAAPAADTEIEGQVND